MLMIGLIILIWGGNIKVVGGFHLELVHGGTSLRDIQLVVVLAGHNRFLLSICGALRLLRPVGYRRDSMCAEKTNMPKGEVIIFADERSPTVKLIGKQGNAIFDSFENLKR